MNTEPNGAIRDFVVSHRDLWPVLILFPAGLAFALGFFVPLDLWEGDPTTKYGLWCGAVGLACAFTAASAIIGVATSREARWYSRSTVYPLKEVLGLLVLFVILGAIFVWLLREGGLFADTDREVTEALKRKVPWLAVPFASTLMTVLQIPLFASLVVLTPALHSIRFETGEVPTALDVKNLKKAVSARWLLLNLNAGAIVLEVLASAAFAALRNTGFNDHIVLLTGAALSLWLAIAYFPVHAEVDRLAEELVDLAQPLTPGAEDIVIVRQRRDALRQEIGAGGDVRTTLTHSLVVAAPFFSSALLTLLGPAKP